MEATFKDIENVYVTDTKIFIAGAREIEERSLSTLQVEGVHKKEYTNYFVQSGTLYGTKNKKIFDVQAGSVVASMKKQPVWDRTRVHISSACVYLYTEPTETDPAMHITILSRAEKDKASSTRELSVPVAVSQDSSRTGPLAIYVFAEDVLFIAKNNAMSANSSIVKVDLQSGATEAWADLPGVTITALCKSHSYLVAGTSSGWLVTHSLSTKTQGRTAIHPGPVVHLLPHTHDFVLSSTHKHHFVLTDCASLQNTYAAQTYSASTVHANREGYLVVVSPTHIGVHDISAKLPVRQLFCLGAAEQTHPTAKCVEKIAEYTPDIRKTSPIELRSETHLSVAREASKCVLEDGHAYYLNNMILFHNEETNEIYMHIALGDLVLQDFLICKEGYAVLMYKQPPQAQQENTYAFFSSTGAGTSAFFRVVSLFSGKSPALLIEEVPADLSEHRLLSAEVTPTEVHITLGVQDGSSSAPAPTPTTLTYARV
ncbi:hypothetical protein NECID01_0847 [Nematocida sp. AWRm77]|nr:hypothetical protein NECID01_0847 [Nematocida sp. AWRm77]